jgi:hypothetical protein
MHLADDALEDLDLKAIDRREEREFLLDRVWKVFTSPQALAAAQLWFAAWAEPELASALRELEERLTAILMAAAAAVLPDFVDDPDFPALVDTGASVIRGLVMAIPVSGREAVEERWLAIRPILSGAASDLLGRPASERHRPAA